MSMVGRVPTSPVPPPHRGERLVPVYTSTPAASASPAYRQALIAFRKTVFAWPRGYPLGRSASARIVSWSRLVVPTGRFQRFLRAATTDPIPAPPAITKAEPHQLAEADWDLCQYLHAPDVRAPIVLLRFRWICRTLLQVRIRARMPVLETQAPRWTIPVLQPPRHDQLEDGQEPPPPVPDAIQLIESGQKEWR
jgi:hypothetical protein